MLQQVRVTLVLSSIDEGAMFIHSLRSLRGAFASANRNRSVRPNRVRRHGRRLAIESLEQRQMLSITPLQSINSSQDTGEKPQSKVFQYAGQWWTVMPNSSGTWVYRLDGTSWTATQKITSNTSVHADVKLVGDLAHVLLYNGTSSQLATLQYDAGPDNRFEPWSLRPQLVNVSLSSGVETATLEVDSTGRMWIASDASSTVQVRYSDGLYTSWSCADHRRLGDRFRRHLGDCCHAEPPNRRDVVEPIDEALWISSACGWRRADAMVDRRTAG